jgi:hypothetical protein
MPYRRSGRDSDDSGDAEDGVTGTKLYDFSPSRLFRVPSHDQSLAASGSEIEASLVDAEKRSEQNDIPGKPKRTRVFQVHRSEYTGDAFTDGNHSAKLTVIDDPKKSRQILFRWM